MGQGNRKFKYYCRINDLHTVNTPSRPPGTLPLTEGKGQGWCLLTHEQRYYRHFSHFAIALGVWGIFFEFVVK